MGNNGSDFWRMIDEKSKLHSLSNNPKQSSFRTCPTTSGKIQYKTGIINFLDPGLRRDDDAELISGSSLSWTRSRIPLRSTVRDDEGKTYCETVCGDQRDEVYCQFKKYQTTGHQNST